MGALNKFALAPGSIGDMTSGGKAYPLPFPAASEAVPVGAVWSPYFDWISNIKDSQTKIPLVLHINMIKNR